MKTSVEELIELLAPAFCKAIPQGALQVRKGSDLLEWPACNRPEINCMIRGRMVIMGRDEQELSGLEIILDSEFGWKPAIIAVTAYKNPNHPDDQIIRIAIVYGNQAVGTVIINDWLDELSSYGVNSEMIFDSAFHMANALCLMLVVAQAVERFCDDALKAP